MKTDGPNANAVMPEALFENIYWKEKENAYFEFLKVGFILRTLFFLISAIYTH